MPRLRPLLVIALLLGAGCSGSGHPGSSATRSGSSVASTTSTAAGRGVTTAPASASAPGPAASPTSTLPGSTGTAARQVLDTYLAALTRLDANAAQTVSSNGPAAFVAVQSLVAAFDATQGGKTTVTLSAEQFSPTTATADKATFDGSVMMTIEVTGSKGTSSSHDTISGPVTVAHATNGWHVTSFTYDGQPLVYFPEQARQMRNSVEFDVVSILSYGASTTALVGLGSQNGHQGLSLTSTQLVAGGRPATGHGFFVNNTVTTGFFGYPRVSSRPTELDASFRTSSGSTIDFAVPLAGQAT